MDSNGVSINIDDHEIWEQRRARLIALESVSGTQLQAETKYRLSVQLYATAKEGDVEEFINALEKCSAEERISLSDIINITGPSGNSLLHVAAGIEKADILRALLEVFCDMQLAAGVNNRGETALHVAARAGRICTADLLLGCSSIVEMSNDTGNTALHETVKNRHYELTRMLLSRGSGLVYQKNKESKCPLYLAVEMGDLKNLKLLMEAGSGQEVPGSHTVGLSPVHGALIHKRIEMLKEMSERAKELFYLRGVGGNTPLHLAASINSVDGAEFLIDKFPSSAFESDEKGCLPIHIACKKGHLEIIKKLLPLWPNPDELLTLKKGRNILHVAAKYGGESVINYILDDPKLKKSVNAKDKEGNTPLHLAASHLQVGPIFALILEDEVDLKLVNNRNLTAFDIADEQMKKIDVPHEAFQQWALPILKAVKAPRSKDTAICGTKDEDPGIDAEPQHLDRLKGVANTRMVVATLVAAMTFAAGFSVPGGYNGSEPDAGIATLLHKPMYDIFVICNTIAMYCSIVAVVILLRAQPNQFASVDYFLKKSRLPLLIALATMSVAFMAGVYVTVSTRTWVAVVVLIIGVTALFHILAFYSYFFRWPLYYFVRQILVLVASYCRRLSDPSKS